MAVRLYERFKTFVRFRNKLLEMHRKNKDDVYDKFDRETQKEGESVTKYIERLEVILSSPTGKFKRGDVCAFIWEKLP